MYVRVVAFEVIFRSENSNSTPSVLPAITMRQKSTAKKATTTLTMTLTTAITTTTLLCTGLGRLHFRVIRWGGALIPCCCNIFVYSLSHSSFNVVALVVVLFAMPLLFEKMSRVQTKILLPHKIEKRRSRKDGRKNKNYFLSFLNECSPRQQQWQKRPIGGTGWWKTYLRHIRSVTIHS